VKRIFSHSRLRDFKTLFHSLAAHYDTTGLEGILTEQFGDHTLGQLKKKVFIPTFELDSTDASTGSRRWVPHFIHNIGDQSPCNGLRLVDVAMRTSAAPTYFPIHQGFVDGGVYANNPALCAVTTAIDAGINIQDIVVLSLSTGRAGHHIDSTNSNGDWGLVQWVPHLTDMLMDSCQEVIDYQCSYLLGSRYNRVDPFLPDEIPLDSDKDYGNLVNIAKRIDLAATEKWIQQVWTDTATAPASVTPISHHLRAAMALPPSMISRSPSVYPSVPPTALLPP